MTNIEKTELFRQFVRRAPDIATGPRDLAHEFDRLRTLIQDAEKYVVLSFPEYTPHDHARHFDGLFALADRLLGLKIYDRLGSAELALLVLGLYAHDWGMAVTEAELHGLFHGESQEQFEMLAGEPSAAREYLSQAAASRVPHETAWREYIRRTHAARSGARLRGYFERTSGVFADAVAKIAEGHTLDLRELRDSDRYPIAQSVFGETVNIAALATYVRIIDLLDVGDDRTPYALWKFVSPLNEISKIEWQKHRALSPAAVTDNDGIREVIISGYTNDPKVFSALADLRSWIDSQFAESIAFLRTMPHKYDPTIDSRIRWDIEAVGFSPLLVRFECERGAVLNLLSNELYKHDPLAFVRELLQNSVDAIDSRDTLLRNAGLTLNGIIRVELRSANGSVYLEWSDNGIGMNEDILLSYFASVGQSWYKSREAQRLGDSHPVSQFGIGVLSFFAVSDHVTVATRRDPHAGGSGPGLTVEIPGRESYFRIQPAVDLPVGTLIRLVISPRQTTVSNESIIAALARICRFVRHSVIVELDDMRIDLGASAPVHRAPGLTITAGRGTSAQLIQESCTLVDVEFGSQSDDLHGCYSALIPKSPDQVQQPVKYKTWQIGSDQVDLEDIVTDSEQSVFTKGIQVGPVVPRRRVESNVYIGARHTDWIAPKLLLNVRRPSCLEFELNRSGARFASDELMRPMWSEIARKLRTQILDHELGTGAEVAILLGTCALFGGIPDAGLRALIETDDTPLLVLRFERGTSWQFMREFIQGPEFSEAPFELAYAVENSGTLLEQNALAGWQGENVLFPASGCSTRRPPYLRSVLDFGYEILIESGWLPCEVRLVKPPSNESVPLACRVWKKREAAAFPASCRLEKGTPGWNTLKAVYRDAPELLCFPPGAEQYAGIGSRYWNVGHPKVLAIVSALTGLARRLREAALPAERARLFSYLTSNSFYGYTVPSRLSGKTLAIDLPNRLLDLAQQEKFACATRLAPSDFLPGTVGGYHNPYHYALNQWEVPNTDLGQPLQP